MEKYQVGEVLSRTFSVFGRSFPKLIAMAAVIYSPYITLQFVFPGSVDELTGLYTEHPVATILGFFLGPLLTAAATYEVLQRVRGETASLGACLNVGISRLLPVLVVNILMGLAIVIGIFLLIVPGLIFMTMLAVSVPVCVVERPGIFASLNRSSDLTKGSRWAIFATVLIFGVMYMMTVGVLIGLSMAGAQGGWVYLPAVVTTCVTIVLGALQAVMMATVYHELRTKKEGAASDELVAVFA